MEGGYTGSGHGVVPPQSCNIKAAHDIELLLDPTLLNQQASWHHWSSLNLNNAQLLPIMYFHTWYKAYVFTF